MGLDPSFWTDAHSFCCRCAAAGRSSALPGEARSADKRCCYVAMQSHKQLPEVHGCSLLPFTSVCSSSSFLSVLHGHAERVRTCWASAVAQDGQAAGSEARKGGARPARVGGPFMALMYRFFLTFCNHVRAASCDVLVCQLGV